MRAELVEAAAVEAEWSGVLRTVRAGILAVPSRCAARLPHLTAHDISEIDQEIRAALTDVRRREQPSSRNEDD
jgi:phage terminase Nu1 subunit (DNA packaging protein)